MHFPYTKYTAYTSQHPRNNMGISETCVSGEIGRDAAKRAESFALHLTPVSASWVSKGSVDGWMKTGSKSNWWPSGGYPRKKEHDPKLTHMHNSEFVARINRWGSIIRHLEIQWEVLLRWGYISNLGKPLSHGHVQNCFFFTILYSTKVLLTPGFEPESESQAWNSVGKFWKNDYWAW